ncbi:Uncharacterised protein [Staphylococcus saccharolyticus]|uniref:Uncharacterized protein n=1 Tax=Staphylococcus saccharolyticus TaxID=33028 RepID=A0A380GXC3_9STAP|nr:Uncharacterised protein [Staphylococcus saccharolyticus]
MRKLISTISIAFFINMLIDSLHNPKILLRYSYFLEKGTPHLYHQ